MSTSPAKILLVEDDPQNAKLALFTIRQHLGLDADHVDNGAKAVEYLDRQKPDLIVLDLSLPELNGWKVLDHAKAKYGQDTIKVIVTTAQGDAVNRLTGKLQFVSRYIVKPYIPDQLSGAIRELLNIGT